MWGLAAKRAEEMVMKPRAVCRVLSACLITIAFSLLFSAQTLLAQVDTGSISGIVTDSTGATAASEPVTITVTFAPANVGALAPGTAFTVQVQVAYSHVHLMGTFLIPVPETLTGRVSMVKEGP